MPEIFEKRLKHPCFPQPEKDSWAWRYLTLAKLLDVLRTRSIFLCRLDFFQDSHEGSMPRLLLEARERQFKEMELPPDTKAQFEGVGKRTRSATYVNCWNLSDYESEALWRLYTVDSDGIAIRARYWSLVDVIKSRAGCATTSARWVITFSRT